ncbi:MAG: helix-turn-helix transcriptional regulator [Bacteroidales bacterium]|nr:helix-turn-helix transcriptional regulator [Bacteroidales bacterium]
MQTNDHQIRDYDVVLDAEFGNAGTPERAKALEEAYAFYSGQILHTARKAAGVTQAELAERINSTKSYISKLEKGHVNPSAGLFFSIINALGMRVEIVRQL